MAIAGALATRGAHVVLTGRRSGALNDAANKIRACTPDASKVSVIGDTDVTDETSVVKLFEDLRCAHALLYI